MPPKPFPYPLRIGVDMCSIPRLGQHITDSNWFNRYTRKLFNRLEWPELCMRVAAALEAKDDGAIGSYEDKVHRALVFPAITTSVLKGDERSPAARLLRFLAGRWAAKEATVKAHSRRLLFHDISVVRDYHDPFTPGNHGQGRPSLLVDPPRDTVLFREDIARHRGLRGFNDFTELLEKKQAHDTCYYGRIVDGIFVEGMTGDEEKFFKRRAKIADEDRQCAELSITHDGEYATAVCMACVENVGNRMQKPPIVDDGSGDPLHESEWGDEGFFDS